MHKIAAFGVAAALAALCGIAAARAEVRVSGTAGNVVVLAKAATLADVVAAMEAAFHVRIELKGTTSWQFTGIYSGSLQRVLARLLAGVDYIVHSSAGRITIAIIPQNGAYPSAVAASPNDDSGSSVQGWVPSASQIATAAAAPRAQAVQSDATTDNAGEETSGVQGWVPSALQAVSIMRVMAAAPSQVMATDVEGEPSGVQGWVPAQVAALLHSPTVTAAAADSGALQPLPNNSDGGEDGSVQGWMPTTAHPN